MEVIDVYFKFNIFVKKKIMKKVSILFLFVFCGMISYAQNNLSGLSNIAFSEIKSTLPDSPKTALDFTDTLIYPMFKATDFSFFLVADNPSYCISVGQYFDCPQAVTVKGAVFYGVAYMVPTVNVTVELFLAGPDSLPTGTALASKTMSVDSVQAHVHRLAMFDTPQTVTQPYVVTVTCPSITFPFIIGASDPAANDGQGEWLAVIKQSGVWKKSKQFSGGAKDFDFYIAPVVEYDIADVTFSMDSTCITDDGEIIDFNLINSGIFQERMYNYNAAVDSAIYQFAWNFGDTADTIFGMDTSHQYAVASPYVVRLGYYYRGWYNFVAPAIVQKNLPTCLTPDVSDTLLYPAFKTTSYNYFEVTYDSSKCISVGQYYNCPQTLDVMGVVFYGLSYPDSIIDVTVELYLAGPDSLPVEPALVSQTFEVDSFQAHVHRVLMFSTPQTVDQPYVITITYEDSVSSFIIITSDTATNDGQGEWLALIKQPADSAYKKSQHFSGGAKDIDFLILPVVKYDLAGVTFSMDLACLNSDGDSVNFILDCPDIYKDRMYNSYAATDSAKYQFAWNFGDTQDTIYALDTSHVYETLGAYTINLGYGFAGWYNFILPQITSQYLDICTGVTNINSDDIIIYPNPANDFIYIENAENTSVEIYNLLGAIVISKSITQNRELFSLDGLTKGSYLIKVTDSSGLINRKVVIKL